MPREKSDILGSLRGSINAASVRKTVLSGLLALVLLSPTAEAHPKPHGAVASGDAQATEIGLQVLQRGGNAADAAVATALALAVTLPQAGNIAGGGFAVTRFGTKLDALDFREVAPAAAHRATYLDERGRPVPGASTIGPLAAGIPGTPSGLFALHERHGRLPWTEVVKPAERLARRGFVVSERTAENLAKRTQRLSRFPEAVATWFPGGAAPAPGRRMVLPELAASLRSYARLGPDAFLRGPRAKEVVAAVQAAGGLWTEEDLASYEVAWRQPVRFRLGGWQLASMPLPSSGGLILAEVAGILERHEHAEHGLADQAHLRAEALRRAFADRFFLGDPGSVGFDPRALVRGQRLTALAADIDMSRASRSEPPTSSAPVGLESDETTHLSVVDADGNLVALTTTLNGAFGCGWFHPAWGFLNNEMDDFATAPGRPNLYGLIQGAANEVGPGKRMLSSMSPTVGWKGPERLALGARGGSRIPSAVLHVLLEHVVFEKDLTEAMSSPRLHHQWLPDAFQLEEGALPAAVRQELRERGHQLRRREEIGEVQAVRRHRGGRFEAVSDPRTKGAAGTR
ncbi:MAG: gamma-glutamyltransferase [Acidobacteriota bacterium]